MWYEWFFDGIGSTIVSLVLGAIIGGFTGYKVGIHHTVKLNQKAENSAEQKQIIKMAETFDSTESNHNTNVIMKQKAKNNAKQTQIGGIGSGRD